MLVVGPELFDCLDFSYWEQTVLEPVLTLGESLEPELQNMPQGQFFPLFLHK